MLRCQSISGYVLFNDLNLFLKHKTIFLVVDNCVQAAVQVGIIKGNSYTNYKAKGCNYNGKYIPNGTTLQVTSCESCTCDNGRVFCAVKDCAQPPPGCTFVRTATECCKLQCKKGCVYNGIFIPEGTTSTVAPCTYGTCDGGKVFIAIADCAPPPQGCRYESTIEQCCKMICEKGCNYNGIFIPEGTTSTVAPCTYGTCDGGKVFIAIADCAAPPVGCRYESTMEQCCRLVCDNPPILIKEAKVQ